MSFDYSINIPLSSNNPVFDLLDCYLSDFDAEDIPASVFVDPFERDRILLDLFGNEDNYINSDLFYLSGEECNVVQSTETTTLAVVEGDNHFTPFLDIEDSLSIRLSDSEFINGTAGTNLEDSDIIWQFTGNCLEGAYLRRSDEEFASQTACIKIFPNYNEFRFPYPDRGLSGEGLEWTGKGINNCSITPYTNPELKAVTEEIDNLYWSDDSQLSSVDPVALNESTLIGVDSQAHASNNIFFADQIRKKANRDDTNNDEVAWYFEFDHTELPITCGDNFIYYPLFKYDEDRDFSFTIDVDQVEDIPLRDINVSQTMKGALAGQTLDEADHIYKLNGVCNGIIEGAWLSGCEYHSEEFIYPLSDISEYLEFSDIVITGDDIVLRTSYTTGGEETTRIDCGETITEITPEVPVNIDYVLTGIDINSDFVYSLEFGTQEEGVLSFRLNGLFNNSQAQSTLSDTEVNYELTTDGDNELHLNTVGQDQLTIVDVTPLRNHIRTPKYFIDDTVKQSSFSAVFDSNTVGHFPWTFPDVNADSVINGYGHDSDCPYLSINNFDDITNPTINDVGNQWKECTCRAVYYSPIGNNLDRFDDFTNFSDYIFEDTIENFNLSEWRDMEGRDYRTSPNFGVYVVSSDQNAIEHEQHNGVTFGSTGTWQNYDGTPLVLKEGKKYGYKRSDFGGCVEQTAPCMVFNNMACYDGCQEERPHPYWVKMILNERGEWEDLGEVSDMVMEANDFYNYMRRDSLGYQVVLDNGECIRRATSQPAFNLNIGFNKPLPYWAESPSLGGLNFGSTAVTEDSNYLRSTQPTPSEMIFNDDEYVQYYRNTDTTFEWKQPVNFTVDFDIPNVWKKIDFGFVNPPLLRKIVGCAGCEMVFDNTPANSCQLTLDRCDTFIADIRATDEDSDLIIRSSLNCSDETFLYYRAQEPFTITQTFNTNSSTGGVLSGEYIEASHPWRNLDNEDNRILFDERGGRLVTDEEIGIFKPFIVGDNKIVCNETYTLRDINC